MVVSQQLTFLWILIILAVLIGLLKMVLGPHIVIQGHTEMVVIVVLQQTVTLMLIPIMYAALALETLLFLAG